MNGGNSKREADGDGLKVLLRSISVWRRALEPDSIEEELLHRIKTSSAQPDTSF